MTHDQRMRAIEQVIAPLDSMIVAFSGGVDSSLFRPIAESQRGNRDPVRRVAS